MQNPVAYLTLLSPAARSEQVALYTGDRAGLLMYILLLF